jgi:uncharacterized membrane protein YgaE (UPF0421/DUF939 family)
MKIGMRNIKTALSVFLCVVIFQMFNMGSPFYAAIAAIISMQSSVVDSFKTGKNRMLGTFLGALIGLIFALIGPSNPLLIGLGIMIIISISNWLGWNKSISIAGVVFIAIMVNLNGKSPWTYSLYRIVDTLVGISIAVMINYFISPPINIDKISEHCQMLISMFLEKLKTKLCLGEEINIEELNKKIISLEKEFNNYRSEFKGKKSNSFENCNVRNVIEQLNNILDHLKIIDKIENNPPLTKENSERASKLLNCNIESSKELHDEIALVYNYHIGKIIDYFECTQHK